MKRLNRLNCCPFKVLITVRSGAPVDLRGGCIAVSHFTQDLPSDLFLLIFLPLEEIGNPLLASLRGYMPGATKSYLTILRGFCFLDSCPLF